MNIGNVLSLFDGLSGAQLALKRAGIDYDGYYASEIDEYAVAVTQNNFPNTVQLGDVANIKKENLPPIGLLIGGSPCFVAGTKVLTSVGYKNIENVVEGDLVLTHRNRYQRVLRVGSDKKDIYKLKAQGVCDTETTANHPYYVRERLNDKSFSQPLWREVKELSIERDYIAVSAITDYGRELIAQQSNAAIIEDMVWLPVREVIYTERKETVYNLEVEEDNSYTANNAVVHNCQDLSIAKKGREGLKGSRSGLFWEYVRLLEELSPKWFLLENVASMPKKAKQVITETLGVEPIMINSALVSAQNRKRLYWTNIPNVEQPKDKGILLKDILEPFSAVDERMIVNGKSFSLTASYNGAVEWNSVQRKQRTMVKQEVREDKATTIKSQYYKSSKANFERDDSLHATGVYCYPSDKPIKVGNVYSTEGKSKTLSAGSGVNGNGIGSNNSPKILIEKSVGSVEEQIENKDKSGCIQATYWKENLKSMQKRKKDGLYVTQSKPVKVGELNKGSQGDRVYSDEGKSVALSANSGGTGSKTGLYAVARRGRDSESKGKTEQKIETSYSEKANSLTRVQKDSVVLDATQREYIIRKLTPRECERLQTVPDDYTLVPHPKYKNRMMSNTQRYKMLGNGFTVDVIAHILSFIEQETQSKERELTNVGQERIFKEVSV